MHAVTFQIKRAHLKWVAFGKRVTWKKARGVTPARYDLLYAIRGRRKSTRRDRQMCAIGGYPYATRQDVLRRVLGLDHSTVSLLIKRLVELGWLKKWKCVQDRRTNIIALTKDGIRKIDRAIRAVYEQRTHMLPFELLVKRWQPLEAPLLAIDTLWSRLKAIGRVAGDWSTLHYDFGLSGGD